MMRALEPVEIPVYVVIPPRLLLLDVAGPVEVLRKANLEQSVVHFDVSYVGPAHSIGTSIGLAVSGISRLPKFLPDNALVILAGSADHPLGERTTTDAAEQAHDGEIIGWLKRTIRPSVCLVTICSGALLAARAGLLDNYECTTHHDCIVELARLAPTATVRENRIYVEDGKRLTSAGVTAGIDLMLHIVAQLASHACALSVARYLVIYLRRSGADPQLSPWLEGRNHIHPAIHRVQDAVTANPAKEWSVASLARLAAASPRNLSRLFNEHAGMSVTDFVNRTRVALAHDILTSSRLDLETVAMQSGFASTRQLRRAWGRLHPQPPSLMRSDLDNSLVRQMIDASA
ncbi:MAG: helix-turn-helix domain-containing protein [Mesorhizobium sp.]